MMFYYMTVYYVMCKTQIDDRINKIRDLIKVKLYTIRS